MQKLSHYCLTPALKALPYAHYFSTHSRAPIYCLNYLWGYCRAPGHKKQLN